MNAARATWAKRLRRQALYLRLLTLPLPLLAFGLGALAVHLTNRDNPRECLQDVNAFVKHVESSLPSDPTFVSFVFRRVTEAAELCEKGQPADAQEVLETLRESLRV